MDRSREEADIIGRMGYNPVAIIAVLIRNRRHSFSRSKSTNLAVPAALAPGMAAYLLLIPTIERI